MDISSRDGYTPLVKNAALVGFEVLRGLVVSQFGI